jgi:hypothetical protein
VFFLPGWLIALITFPGVIVHEFAHRFFCDVTGTPVYAVRYFEPMANPAGYVVHARPRRLTHGLLIAFGPVLVNTALCSLLTVGAAYQLILLDGDLTKTPILIVLAWVGYSIGMHAIPSRQDAASFVAQVHEARGSGPVLAVARGAAAVVRVLNILRRVWIDALYAVGVSLVIPLLLSGF